MSKMTQWTVKQWVKQVGWFTRAADPLDVKPYLEDGPPVLLIQPRDNRPFDLFTFADWPTYRLPLDLSDIENGTIKIGKDWYPLDTRLIAIDLKNCEQINNDLRDEG